MIRIAVVEDDKGYQRQLVNYIRKYEEGADEKIDISLFGDGDVIIENYSGNYDIIFMDIEMRRLNGMEAARIIRKLDEDVIIIFITNMAQYAIQGYEVAALDYVLKPIEYFAFAQEMAKAVKKLKSRPGQYLSVMQDQGVVRLDTRKISYLETQGHNIVIHAEKGTYAFRETMKVMEQKLRTVNFARCNSGYLVNLSYVESVNQNIVTVDGEQLQISRPRKKDFMEALTNYLGGK